MMLCCRCGVKLEGRAQGQLCRKCELSGCEREASSWAAIARLSNLAEAGYFADWLEGEGITARVFHRHSFTAVDDVWNTTYELHVPSADAERAVVILRETLTEDADDEEAAGGERNFERRSSGLRAGSPLLWILVAGSLAYVLGRTGGAPHVQRESQTRLWQVVAESPPLFSEPRAGQPRRCLRYDPQAREIVLLVDLDVDGQWDLQRRFAAVR